jgi:hypothetical protein
MKTDFSRRTTCWNQWFRAVVPDGSALRTTSVHRTSGPGRGPREWSYSPKGEREKETKISLLPRTLCRSFRDLHSAEAKTEKSARAGEEVFA